MPKSPALTDQGTSVASLPKTALQLTIFRMAVVFKAVDRKTLGITKGERAEHSSCRGGLPREERGSWFLRLLYVVFLGGHWLPAESALLRFPAAVFLLIVFVLGQQTSSSHTEFRSGVPTSGNLLDPYCTACLSASGLTKGRMRSRRVCGLEGSWGIQVWVPCPFPFGLSPS